VDKNPTSSFKIGGILAKKIFRKFLETTVINSYRETIPDISAKNFKNFLSGQKSNFKFQYWGYFGEKKYFAKYLETSVINSWLRGHSWYFIKKFLKLFYVDKNPTSSFKIWGIFAKKIFLKSLETLVTRAFGARWSRAFTGPRREKYGS